MIEDFQIVDYTQRMERMFEYTSVSELPVQEAKETGDLKLTADYLKSLADITIEEKIKMALFHPSVEAGKFEFLEINDNKIDQ